jgi:hypothetical protein
MNKRLFIIVNIDSFFLSHRKEIALEAGKKRFDVTVIANDTGKGKEIEALGVKFINLPNAKSIQNLLKELKIFIFLLSLYKHEKPDIVHHVGLKLILYGTIAARMAGVKNVVNAVSGLGIFFS